MFKISPQMRYLELDFNIKMESAAPTICLQLPIEIASVLTKLRFPKAETENFQTAHKSSESNTM